MSQSHRTPADVLVDQLIDDVVARRAARFGRSSGPVAASPSPDAALLADLSGLGETDWPADEAGDRIARCVLAAAVPPHVRQARRAVRTRWLAASAVAAAAALVAGAVLLSGGSGSGQLATTRSSNKPSAHPRPSASAPRGAWLTAMTVVSAPGALKAVGTVSNDDDFLTCVSRSVCYLEASDKHGNPVIVRSVDSGATWTAGVPLTGAPDASGTADLAPSCPSPLTCFTAYGSGMVATTDGFASHHFLPITAGQGVVTLVSCPTVRRCVASIGGLPSGPVFRYTRNGGQTWKAARLPAIGRNDAILALRCDATGACVGAVGAGNGSNALVAGVSSADGGKTWVLSGYYSIGNQQQWQFSCGDARGCLVSGNNGTLAWVFASGGAVSVRVRQFPGHWHATAEDSLACATGADCWVETRNYRGDANWTDNTIEVTRDGGRTWARMTTPDPAASLSCPVTDGCVGLALRGSTGPWIVVSNLGNSG